MSCCCTTVETGTVKIVERCGKFSTILNPGLSIIVPCIDVPTNPISMRLQQIEVSCETKTKDNVFTQMKVSIQFQIVQADKSIYDAHYRLTNPRKQIEAYVYDVVRSTVPKIDLDDVFTTKEEIAASISTNLKEHMAGFGYEILATPITDIEPNAEVKRAMNEINKAKRMRAAAVDAGEAVKIKAIKEAEAEASRTEIQAKASAEAMHLSGVGIARQRQAIMEGLRESVNAWGSEVDDVPPKQVLDLMIVTQYFDMMKDVGQGTRSNALFLDHSPGALNDLAGTINKGFISSLPNSAMKR